MDTNFRRKQLDVDDEDGLLLLQEEFLRAQASAQPAAKAIRVTRKAAADSAVADEQQPANSTQVAAVSTDAAQPSGHNQNAQNSNQTATTCHATLQKAGKQPTASLQQAAEQHIPDSNHVRRPATSDTSRSALSDPHNSAKSASAATDDTAEQQQPMCPSIPGILTEVKEREVAEVAAPAVKLNAVAFPAAVHRKQSKFALGRRQQHQQVQQQHQQDALTPSINKRPALIAPVEPPAAAAAAPSSAAAATAAAAAAAVPAEQAGVHETNLARLAGMTAEEVQEAQDELAARFKPSALEFLRNRRKRTAAASAIIAKATPEGLDQQQQQQQDHQQQQQRRLPEISVITLDAAKHDAVRAAPSGTASNALDVSESNAAGQNALKAAPAAAAPAPAAQTAAAKVVSSLKKGFLSGGAASGKPARRRQQQQQQQQPLIAPCACATTATGDQLPSQKMQNLTGPIAAASTASNAVTSDEHQQQQQPQPLPPAARLRFSLDGQGLELVDSKTPPTPDHEVLMRDNISKAAGAVPQGYTLPEIGVLVRSSHAPQRAAGFRMLAAVLRRAQPSLLHLGPGGDLIPQEVLLDAVTQQQQQQQQGERQGDSSAGTGQSSSSSSSSTRTGVMWHQIWEYALIALRVVTLARIGLDDDNGRVLSAAADVLCVVLSSSSSEMLIEEIAAATAAVSWPVGLRVSLRRLDHSGAWDQVTGLVQAAAAAQQQQQGMVTPDGAADADMDSPEDLAVVDPLAGFMATDPLPRIRFLLQHRSDSTECVIPLLAILEAIAASSSTAAETIIRCKCMPETLLDLLGLPIGNTAAAAASVDTQQQQQLLLDSSSAAAAADLRNFGGFKVGALKLIRCICAASAMACQLLRTAGLDHVVQLLLCTKGAAAAPGSSSSSEVEQQLLLLEALRIWRVSALHGVCLIHMDLMFQFVAQLLQPPVAAAAASSTSSSGDLGSDTNILAQLRWQLTAEAYQLVDTLLRHALLITNGSKTLGSEMITPGCAAAIAQEAAAAWIQNPRVLQQIAEGLVSQVDCSLPYNLDPNPNPSIRQGLESKSRGSGFSNAESASSTTAWFRALPGMHPALLVPKGFAMLAAFAAVLQFLSSYWSSLQVVPQQLAQDLLDQLQAVGLASNSSSSSSSSAAEDAHAADLNGLSAAAAAAVDGGDGDGSNGGAVKHATDALAAVLLSAPVKPGPMQQQQWQQQLGQALLQHCVQLLPAAAAAPGSQIGTGSSSRDNCSCLLANHALGAAACAALLAVFQLQQQLNHLTHQQQQQQQGLGSLVVTNIVNNMLCQVSAYNRTLVMDPWRLALHSMRLCQIRTFLTLAKLLLQQSPKQQQQQQHQHQQQQQQQQQSLLMCIIDGLLCVPPLLGPGHESEALQALRLLFEPQVAHARSASDQAVQQQQQQQTLAALLLPAAIQAVQQLVQHGGPLAAAAAGVGGDDLPTGFKMSDWPYAPTAVVLASAAAAAADDGTASGGISSSSAAGVDTALWCKVLLDGYAVTWLSVIARQRSSSSSSSAQPQHQQQQGSGSSDKPLLTLPRVYVSEVEGSRLPVPSEWIMSEILQLPQLTSSSSSSGGKQQQQGPMHPVSAALLLAAGLERSKSISSSSSSYIKAVRTYWKLEALYTLLYLFNVGELLHNNSHKHGHIAAAAGLVLSWQQPDARWAAAVLTQRYVGEIMHSSTAAAAAARPGNYSGHSGSITAPAADCPIRSTLPTQQQFQQRQQQSLLFPSWAAAAAGSQIVDRLVSDLADISMGDPLFCCHVALLLLPASGVKLQRALWKSLGHNACLHLLPEPSRCVGGSRAYLGVQLSKDSKSQPDIGSIGVGPSTVGLTVTNDCVKPWFDIHLVGDMAKSLAQVDLRKALKMGGVAGFMALHGIAAVALDQNAWRQDVAGSCTVTAGSSSSGTAASCAAMAVNILRGVVRACSIDVLQQLVSAGRVRTLSVEHMSRALVQCAHGDAQLIEKVRQLLSLIQ